MASNLLISEVDARDPFTSGLVGDDLHPGPLLSLVTHGSFDDVLLLVDVQQDATPIIEALRERAPWVSVQQMHLPEVQTQDYRAISATLEGVLAEVHERNLATRITVSLSSGTPARHVAWMQLAQRHGGIALASVDLRGHIADELPTVDVSASGAPEDLGAALREEPPPQLEDVARELGLVGAHPSFLRTLDTAANVARLSIPALITGEPGTGKTTLARFMARLTMRRPEPFITFDSKGLPDLLSAASLFGNAEGAVRGSGAASVGRIEAAGRGTLLIENAEDLPRRVQEQLAHYIATGTFRSLGSEQAQVGHARVILTSSDASQHGGPRLLSCLCERLRTGRIHIPPLHERRTDIPLIVLHYLRRINESVKEPRTITRQALEAMQFLTWSNNVRDLRLAVERSALFANNTELTLRDIRAEGTLPAPHGGGGLPLPELTDEFSLEGYLSEMRRRLILRALELAKGNQSEAARLLRITPQAVHQFLKLQTKRK